jgi:DNA polymerase II large subunit
VDSEAYFRTLEEGVKKAYALAQEARKRGIDPAMEPEIPLAKGLAERVEGLVGPEGVARRIQELDARMPKEEVAIQIAKEIVSGHFGSPSSQEAGLEQALRTSLAILTEGIVAAPLEGIVNVRIKRNPDHSPYLAIYFAGPIRSAGGSAQALAVLTGDCIRRVLGLDRYKPTEEEIERFVEETDLYNAEASRLQYYPSSEEVRTAIRNIPVEVTGESTERLEVSAYRNLERIETNQLRGGAVLVVAEGVLQKAPKLHKHVRTFGLDGWEWLEDLQADKEKKEKAEERERAEVGPNSKYIQDLIAGRPVLSYPSTFGGFRLRYGRCRTSGFAAASLHPATMALLGDFIAIGTQIKTERPGKGAAVTPCDALEGPLVKLADGSVQRVETYEEGLEVRAKVKEILFLGDLLLSYGDFLENNHPLMPAGYTEEWWLLELEAALEGEGGEYERFLRGAIPTPEEALRLSTELSIPLHPRYTYYFEHLSLQELEALREWLRKGEFEEEGFILPKNEEGKRILEALGVPHRVEGGTLVLEEHLPLRRLLGLTGEPALPWERALEGDPTPLEVIRRLGIPIREKGGTFIGARMGRPEKARERKMQPAVNALFPIGQAGGRTRDVKKAAQKGEISVEIVRRECSQCKRATIKTLCPTCGRETEVRWACPSCGHVASQGETCRVCGGRLNPYETKDLDLKGALDSAIYRVGNTPHDLKGVIGMTSTFKIPEPLEKGILRSRHQVYVFKDGTTRFDATDVPLTHFRPREIGTALETLRRLGYERDIEGNPLENQDQLLELKCQDLFLPRTGASYLLKASRFVDELLEKVYGLEPFYRAEREEDLVGHLVLGLAPHTSAAILGRIIGFTDAQAGYAHPYFHAAKRRNCDGDEDSVFLLVDALVNFSRSFLPRTRGGKMDAPLVLTIRLDPREVDDEVHNLDVGKGYPIEFYEATWRYARPQELRRLVPTVRDRIGGPDPYSGFRFTHDTGDIAAGPTVSAYKTLGTMLEKVQHQLDLARKIRAVDDRNVAKRLIESHFLPDLAGNLRTFSKQVVRCVDCNAKYRRVPLVGKCRRCSGKLVLTVSHKGVEKYLNVTKDLIDECRLDDYLRQRVRILEASISSVFENEGVKQVSLGEFLE